MEGRSRKLIAASFLLVHKSINVNWKHPSVNALNGAACCTLSALSF